MRHKAIFLITIAAAVLLGSCQPALAQSRSNRIYRPCPASTTAASVAIDRDGNIAIVPCGGKTLTSPGVPLTAQTTTNTDYTTNAIPTNTTLNLTVPTAGTYEIDLVVHGTEAAGGLRFDFAGTATVAYFIGQWTGRTIDMVTNKGARVSTPGTDFTDILLAGQDTIYTFRGSAEFSSGGTFILRAAQNTSNGFPSTLERGSTLKLTRSN